MLERRDGAALPFRVFCNDIAATYNTVVETRGYDYPLMENIVGGSSFARTTASYFDHWSIKEEVSLTGLMILPFEPPAPPKEREVE